MHLIIHFLPLFSFNTAKKNHSQFEQEVLQLAIEGCQMSSNSPSNLNGCSSQDDDSFAESLGTMNLNPANQVNDVDLMSMNERGKNEFDDLLNYFNLDEESHQLIDHETREFTNDLYHDMGYELPQLDKRNSIDAFYDSTATTTNSDELYGKRNQPNGDDVASADGFVNEEYYDTNEENGLNATNQQSQRRSRSKSTAPKQSQLTNQRFSLSTPKKPPVMPTQTTPQPTSKTSQ